jgi:serine O-acetyltransferase
MFDNVRADMTRYSRYGGWLRSSGFWVTLAQRFGFWSNAIRPVFLGLPLRLLAQLMLLPWRLFKDVHIDTRVEMGPGLLIVHPHSIYVPRGATIGASCCLFHEVTLGEGPIAGVPTLGDHVVLFAGARVLGGINIGERAEIGANAVVVKDVPPQAVVLGPIGRAVPSALAEKMCRRESGAAPRVNNTED